MAPGVLGVIRLGIRDDSRPDTDPARSQHRIGPHRSPTHPSRSDEALGEQGAHRRAELPAGVEVRLVGFADHRHRRWAARQRRPVVIVSTARTAPVVSLLPWT